MENYLEDEEENMMYAKMVTKEELANIVNQNPEYKKSPTIQQIFKMNNFKVDKKEQVSFNFNNIICRDTNLIEVENKKRAVNILLNAILDCNSSVRMRKIQKVVISSLWNTMNKGPFESGKTCEKEEINEEKRKKKKKDKMKKEKKLKKNKLKKNKLKKM